MSTNELNVVMYYGASVVAVGISLLFWLIGFVVAIRYRSASGARLLSAGFCLLALDTLLSGATPTFSLLVVTEQFDFSISTWAFSGSGVSFHVFQMGLHIVAVALVIIGAFQALRFAGRARSES